GLQAVYVREVRLWKEFDVVSTVVTWEDTQVIGRHRFVLEDGQTAALVMTTAGVDAFKAGRCVTDDEIVAARGAEARPRPPSEEERIFMASHGRLRQLAKGVI